MTDEDIENSELPALDKALWRQQFDGVVADIDCAEQWLSLSLSVSKSVPLSLPTAGPESIPIPISISTPTPNPFCAVFRRRRSVHAGFVGNAGWFPRSSVGIRGATLQCCVSCRWSTPRRVPALEPRNDGNDAPIIGRIPCREGKRLVAEYALRDIDKPMAVAEWRVRLTRELPAELEDGLPSIEEIEQELTPAEQGGTRSNG